MLVNAINTQNNNIDTNLTEQEKKIAKQRKSNLRIEKIKERENRRLAKNKLRSRHN